MRYPHNLINFRLFEALRPHLTSLVTLCSGKIAVITPEYESIYRVEYDFYDQIYVEIYKEILDRT